MHFLMRFKRVGLVSVLVFHSSISAIAAAKVQSVLIMPFICNLNESPSPSPLFFFFLNKYIDSNEIYFDEFSFDFLFR